MSKHSVARFFKSAQLWTSKHSPEILTGIGIGGMITTTVLAVKATPKALDLLNDAAIKKVDEQVLAGKGPDEIDDKLTAIEVVKAAWRPYIPAAITCTASIACLIGARSVSARRSAALATAYKLSETALNEYREKVIETIGDKKEKVIREKIAEDRLAKAPVDEAKVIVTDKGSQLCMEPVSGRYFRSDIDQIKRVINDLNEQLLNDPFGYLSLNDLYDELGLESTDRGDDLGWNVSSGIIRVDFHAKIAKNGEPCIVIDYTNAPVYDYNKFS